MTPTSARRPGLRRGRPSGSPEDVSVDGGVIADALPAGAAGDLDGGGRVSDSGPDRLPRPPVRTGDPDGAATAGSRPALDMSSPPPLVAALRGTARVTDIRSAMMALDLAGERPRAPDAGHPGRGGRRSSPESREVDGRGRPARRAGCRLHQDRHRPPRLRPGDGGCDRRGRAPRTACRPSRTRPLRRRDDGPARRGRRPHPRPAGPAHRRRSRPPSSPRPAAVDRPDADDDEGHRAAADRARHLRADVRAGAGSVTALHRAGVADPRGHGRQRRPRPRRPHRRSATSLHDELALLVDAGLSPGRRAALRRPRSPPTTSACHDRGRIAAGLRADLVLLEDDPTSTSPPPGAIRGVWIAGEQMVGGR